jgi:hypothetical protein
MLILSPEERAQAWHEAVSAEASEREFKRHMLASAVFPSRRTGDRAAPIGSPSRRWSPTSASTSAGPVGCSTRSLAGTTVRRRFRARRCSSRCEAGEPHPDRGRGVRRHGPLRGAAQPDRAGARFRTWDEAEVTESLDTFAPLFDVDNIDVPSLGRDSSMPNIGRARITTPGALAADYGPR